MLAVRDHALDSKAIHCYIGFGIILAMFIKGCSKILFYEA